MRLLNIRILTLLCLAAVCSLPAAAAVKMTQTVVFHGYGPSHAGRNTAKTTTLIQGVRSRTETSLEFEGKVLKRLTGKQFDISITDAEAKVMRTLNPKRETYTEITFEQFLTQRDDLADQLAALRGQPAQRSEEDDAESRPRMEFGPPEITVNEAGTATIAGFDAHLLDVLVKMVGKYPESTATCDIHVKANLGFAETPGSDEVQAFYAKLAEELGFSKSQMLGAGQSVLSAMGNYAEGFEKLYEEIRKQKGTLVRQNLRVEVKGACGGPGGAGAPPDAEASAPAGDPEPAGAKARAKKMFGKLKFGRKKKDKEEAPPENPPAAEAPPAEDFVLMLALDMETDTYEKLPDGDTAPFDAPSGWKKVEPRGLPTDR